MREHRQFIDFLENRQSQSMTLATLTKTSGSTYRKAGAQKIIAPNGDSCGLISGGCLEGEIVQTASRMKSPTETHTFDTTAQDDRLFGYTIGCQGTLTIEFAKKSWDVLYSQMQNPPAKQQLSVVVLGAGADIDPLKDLLDAMGWQQSYLSFRSDLVADRSLQRWSIQHVDPNFSIAGLIDLPDRTAVLLMSHNYPADLEMLSQLAKRPPLYIGVLGPAERKKQMFADLEKIYKISVSQDFKKRVRGPVGLPGLGRGESAIGLAIVSDLQRAFFAEDAC